MTGEQFSIYPFAFDDETKPLYSKLGKVYTDRTGQIWLLPTGGTPYKFDSGMQKFHTVEGVEDVSVIFQDKGKNIWFGTNSNGLYYFADNSADPIKSKAVQVLRIQKLVARFLI